MLNQLIRRIEGLAKDWKLLVGWLLLTALVNGLLVAVSAPMAPHRPLDLWFGGYTADQAYQLLEELGWFSFSAYVITSQVDMLFPLCYAPLNAMLIARFWNVRFRSDSSWRLVCLLPILGAALDYLENACIDVALLTYPDRHDAALSLAGVVTPLKWWGCAFPSLALIVVGVVWSGAVALTHRRRTDKQ